MKVLATKLVPIEDLSPFPENPRNGDVDAIGESLDEHGQYRAIVVWASNGEGAKPMQILAGNHTFFAAGERGRKKLLSHLIECSYNEAKRICLADNRTSDLAVYDNQQLADLLVSLGGDFSGTGYSQDSLNELLERIEAEGKEPISNSAATLTCPACGHEALSTKFKPE